MSRSLTQACSFLRSTQATQTGACCGYAHQVTTITNQSVYDNTVARFRENRIALPTFAELADPSTIPEAIVARLADVDRMAPDPLNLWRVHWHNTLDGGRVDVPEHIVLPKELTGVDATIVLAFGNRFPMIKAHKVLAAYACLVPRIVTGEFDPTANRAIWPSTGNYARGGVAISRLMGCRGVAVLPEGMSQERFDWLDEWLDNPEDVIRTTGTESNVKEIYDECARLRQDPVNVILNQFSEYSNHMGHYAVTGPALERVFNHVAGDSGKKLAAFVSASGSAGTLGTGDYLKDTLGARIVAVEALECPTMLENGYGEHNIQGIGDKHIPLIHNVTNTDLVVAISDDATDTIDILFNSPAGREYLTAELGLAPELVDLLVHMGFSSICNALAAIKAAKQWELGADDVIVTVATDGHELYLSEFEKTMASRYPNGFTAADAAEVYTTHIAGADTSAVLEMTPENSRRVFNLGYYTWVEQQGTPFEEFEARRDQSFWDALRPLVGQWDEGIAEFNERSGVRADLLS